ncbi:MAG: hypothetical protein AB8F78_04315 [Saprospiraceae bacterium]
MPINQLSVYRESSSSLSGIEARIGGKFFIDEYRPSRFYLAIDAWMLNNPVKAEAFVRVPGTTSYRVQTLKLNRKRQMVVPSFGYQLIAGPGFSLDLQLGLSLGRRGIFAENDVTYLNVAQDAFFTGRSVDQNQWGPFVDARLGFALGYAF